MKGALAGVKASFGNIEAASSAFKKELAEAMLFAKKNRKSLRFQGFWQIMQITIAAILIFGVGFMVSRPLHIISLIFANNTLI